MTIPGIELSNESVGRDQPVVPFMAPKPKKKWLRRLLVFLAVVLAVLIVLLAPAAISGYGVYKRVELLKSRVEPIMEQVKAGQWSQVSDGLGRAQADLEYIQAKMSALGPVAYLPVISGKLEAVDYLLTASVRLVSGFKGVTSLMASVDFEATGEGGVAGGLAGNRKALLEAISKNRELFDRIDADLGQARQELSQVDVASLLGSYGQQFESMYRALEAVLENSGTAMPIMKRLPEIMGLGQEKAYLVVFQNNMEMRASGGFIGSYAIVKVKDGEITSIYTDDVYNLDKLSKDKLNAVAPAPVQTYLKQNYWFMRDSNWSPDWPTSARQVSWFFETERRIAGLPAQPIDGVIAITPDLISDMLAIVGDVELYGHQFQAEGFAMDLEKFVEVNYEQQGIPTDQRKSIIGPMAQIILDRLQQLSPSQMMSVWSSIQESMDQKHIQMYFTDRELEDYFLDQDWAGAVDRGDGDFLMVVDSNMAALKTDSVMDKSISYSLKETDSGDLDARAMLTYKHTGQYHKYFVSMYRDYLRVYVPQGSRITGAKIIDGDKQTLLSPSNLVIYDELGKTVVGLFFTVDIGGQRQIVLDYQLPQSVKDQVNSGLYKLFVQKQAGTGGHNLGINLEFNQRIGAHDYFQAPESFSVGTISWKTDLSRDRQFNLKFQ